LTGSIDAAPTERGRAIDLGRREAAATWPGAAAIATTAGSGAAPISATAGPGTTAKPAAGPASTTAAATAPALRDHFRGCPDQNQRNSDAYPDPIRHG